MRKTYLLALVLLAAPAFAQPLLEAVARGKAVFEANCQNCHGANGQGAAAGVPALDGSAVVKYDTARQLRTVIDGRTNRGMPSWAKLTDEQIADVITFTKNQWSNQTGVIMAPGLVRQAREVRFSCPSLALDDKGVQIGTARRIVSNAAGTVDVWWCQYVDSTTPNGFVKWNMQRIVDLKDCRDPARLLTGAGRVIAAGTNAMTQFTTELREAAASCVIQEGTQKYYEVQRLAYLGCVELAKNPPPGTPVDWLKPANAPATWQPADHCVAPVPPVTTTPQWITSGTSSYNTAAGALSSYAGSITRGLACNDTLTIRVGTSTYKNFAGASKPTIVAQCVRTSTP